LRQINLYATSHLRTLIIVDYVNFKGHGMGRRLASRGQLNT